VSNRAAYLQTMISLASAAFGVVAALAVIVMVNLGKLAEHTAPPKVETT
jgi:hypothetical protein